MRLVDAQTPLPTPFALWSLTSSGGDPKALTPGGPGRQPAGLWAELIGQEDPLLAVTREPEQQVEKRTWRAQAARVQGTSKTLRPQRDEDGLPTAKHKQETANFFKMKNNKLPEVRSVQE